VLRFAAKRTVKEFAVLVLTAGIIAHTKCLCDSKKSVIYDRCA